MSTEQNTVIQEDLAERMSRMLPKLTPAVISDFEQYLAQNDLEGAMEYVRRLETEYGLMPTKLEELEATDIF